MTTPLPGGQAGNSPRGVQPAYPGEGMTRTPWHSHVTGHPCQPSQLVGDG